MKALKKNLILVAAAGLAVVLWAAPAMARDYGHDNDRDNSRVTNRQGDGWRNDGRRNDGDNDFRSRVDARFGRSVYVPDRAFVSRQPVFVRPPVVYSRPMIQPRESFGISLFLSW